jgi:hypothetical protein
MHSENQPRSHGETNPFALLVPPKILETERKQLNKHRGIEIIYTIYYLLKSRYTSRRRYAIRNRGPTKQKKKEIKNQGKTCRRHRRRLRAGFEGACRDEGPSDLAGECPLQTVVQVHKTLLGGERVRMQERLQ